MAMTSLLGLGISVLAGVFFYGQLSLKVDQLWKNHETMADFQLRRGMEEAVAKKLGTMNSPLTFFPDALAKLEPLKWQLQALYRRHSKMPDKMLVWEIEYELGDALLRYVCLPMDLSEGSCLLMALCVAKGTDQIDIFPEDKKQL